PGYCECLQIAVCPSNHHCGRTSDLNRTRKDGLITDCNLSRGDAACRRGITTLPPFRNQRNPIFSGSAVHGNQFFTDLERKARYRQQRADDGVDQNLAVIDVHSHAQVRDEVRSHLEPGMYIVQLGYVLRLNFEKLQIVLGRSYAVKPGCYIE